jgi:hypothetical protein
MVDPILIEVRQYSSAATIAMGAEIRKAAEPGEPVMFWQAFNEHQ